MFIFEYFIFEFDDIKSGTWMSVPLSARNVNDILNVFFQINLRHPRFWETVNGSIFISWFRCLFSLYLCLYISVPSFLFLCPCLSLSLSSLPSVCPFVCLSVCDLSPSLISTYLLLSGSLSIGFSSLCLSIYRSLKLSVSVSSSLYLFAL
jgi:hypothetical protein